MTRKVRKSCKLCQHEDRDGLEQDILAGNFLCDDLDSFKTNCTDSCRYGSG